jgi:glycine/D-amino acid oxidase-like deaminating enzyme
MMMNVPDKRQRFDTVVVGGGQAGLAAGYYLAQQGRDFVILDAHKRIGTSWRERWDSLRLFTPAWISSLPGMPLSASADAFLSKNEVADYLEAYATHFDLSIRLNAAVETLTRQDDRYLLTVGDQVLEAEHVPKNIPVIFRHLYWWLMHQAINTGNKIGHRFKEQAEKGGAPLIGIPKDAFKRAGVERVSRIVSVQDGKPQLQDGRVLSVTNVIWCTGFAPDFRWIDLPVFAPNGYPVHARGVAENEPGLYFLGLPFQYTLTSSFIGGVGRDARYIAEQIARRSPARVAQSASAETSLV